MTRPVAYFVALLLCALGAFAQEPRSLPAFSAHYTTKGFLYIPSAEVAEPFENWFDIDLNKSRVDYYDGAVKTFQLALHEVHGVSYKVVPPPAYGPNSEETCWKSDGSERGPIKIQGMLPDLTGFKFMGGDFINGLSTERWEKVIHRAGTSLVSRYTMWVRYKAATGTRAAVVVPVRYDIKGINTLMDNAHFDHYYFDYQQYSPDEIDPEVFHVPVDLTSCKDVDSKDLKGKLTMNPMIEFMRGEDRHVVKAFEQFKREHGKSYKTTEEHTMRLNMFRMNYRFIQSLSRANRRFQVAVNHLADRGTAELNAMRGHFTMNETIPSRFIDDGTTKTDNNTLLGDDENTNFNWILKGAVTPVKDQATCGSCYAFSTTGAVEGAYFVKCKRLLRLSEQSLIDCSWDKNNRGCSGGKVEQVYSWIMDDGGIPLDGEYGPYLNEDGSCRAEDIPSSDRVRIKGFRYIQIKRPAPDKKITDAIKSRLREKGPLSVLISSKSRAFNFYSGGVYDDCMCTGMPQECTRKLDHSVLLVGYGKMNDDHYWLIKNSWSEKWGLNGYILMPQDIPRDCGINFYPSWVEVNQCLNF